jgi:hypothetical protein
VENLLQEHKVGEGSTLKTFLFFHMETCACSFRLLVSEHYVDEVGAGYLYVV